MRAIENPNLSAPRQFPIDAPHVVVIRFLRIRPLERHHIEPARNQIGKDAAHRAVLSRRIHRLKNHDEPVAILRIELRLQQRQIFQNFRKIHIAHQIFIDVDIAFRRKIGELDIVSLFHQISRNINFSRFFHSVWPPFFPFFRTLRYRFFLLPDSTMYSRFPLSSSFPAIYESKARAAISDFFPDQTL